MNTILKLDYSLENPKDRVALVESILAENPNSNLEALADYLILAMEKQERKKRKILTDNRLATINKRETSFEGLTSRLENGEDGIYNLITENNKGQIFQPKVTITKKDLDEIPPLRQLRDAITQWEARLKISKGREAFIIKKALIEMRKDQYLIKNAYRRPISSTHLFYAKHYLSLEDSTLLLDDDDLPIPEGITLLDPSICSIILCNYSKFKQESFDQFEGDLYYLMESFDEIVEIALQDRPLYRRLVECKIDGLQNTQIQLTLQKEFGIKHTVEYISNLWRNKIPKIIASAAEDQWLDHYFLNVEKGKYKKCSCCGKIKLAHNKYFSKNKTAKDGFYSLCKPCRNARARAKTRGVEIEEDAGKETVLLPKMQQNNE